MDLDKIVSDLKKERDRMTSAIEALIGSYSPWKGKKTKTGGRRMAVHSRNSNPNVLMVESAENRHRDDAAKPL